MQKIIFILICILLTTSCVSVYNASNIKNTDFSPSVQDSSSIQILHGFTNYLEQGGNKKQVKKAEKHNLFLLPVSIINSSDSVFTLTADKIEVFNNFEKADVVFFSEYYPKIKYQTWSHLAWYFGGLLGSITVSNDGTSFNYLSPALLLFIPGTINIVKASKSNKILKSDLEMLDLVGSTTPANSQNTGFICIRSSEVGEIFIRLNQ
jgi:hypothetical protein